MATIGEDLQTRAGRAGVLCRRSARLALGAVVVAASAATGPGQTRGHEPATRPSAAPGTGSEAPAPGWVGPARAHFWLRIHRVDRVAADLAAHPLALAWKALAEADGPLAGSLRSLDRSWADFARACGIAPAVLFEVLAADTRLALWADPAGSDFVLVAEVGDHAATLQEALDGLPPAAAGKGMHELPYPFGGRSCIVGLDRGRLVVAGSVAAARRVRSGRPDPGTSLAGDPVFGACGFGEDGREPWLAVFVRLDGAAGARKLPGLAGVAALALRSEVAGGQLRDDLAWILPEGGTPPLPLAATGRPDPRLARLVPPGCPTWAAVRSRPEGLFDLLSRTRVLLPGLADLAARVEEAAGAGAAARLFGGNLLYLGGGHDTATGLVLEVADAVRANEILGRAGTRVELGEAGGIHEFTLAAEGGVVHLALCDDFLLAGPTGRDLSRMVEQYLSGATGEAVRTAFASAPDDAFLVGQEDPGPRIEAADPTGARGLRPSAIHFDRASLTGRRSGRRADLELAGTTGAAHLALLGLAQVLPGLLEGHERAVERRVLALAEEVAGAEEAFLDLHLRDRDEDQVGEAGSIPELIETDLFTLPAGADAGRGEVVEDRGYRFKVLRPDDIAGAEAHCAVLAWPARPGLTGRASFVLLRDGSLWSQPWIRDLDVAAGPTPAQVFGPAGWTSRPLPAWEQRRDAAARTAERPAGPPARPDKVQVARAQLALDRARRRMDGAAIQGYLDHPDPTIRARAAHYLGDIKDLVAVPQLIRMFEHAKTALLRRQAARSLAWTHDPRTLPALVRALHDDDAKIRLFAATGLLGARSAAAKEALVTMIDDFPGDREGERSQAVLALHDSGDPSVLASLAGVTASGPRFAEAVVYAFQDLSPSLPAARETEILTKALASPIQRLRAYAIQRLGAARRTAALPALISRLEQEVAALQPALRVSIEALTPPEEGGVRHLLARAGRSLKGAARRLARQPLVVRYALCLSPVVLLLLLLLYRNARGRARRRLAETRVEDLVRPSAEIEPDPAALDAVAAGVDETADEG